MIMRNVVPGILLVFVFVFGSVKADSQVRLKPEDADKLLLEKTEPREVYINADRVLQAAYDNMKRDDGDKELENLRSGYIRRLRRLLEYHLMAAKDAGANAEVEAIKKLMKSLP